MNTTQNQNLEAARASALGHAENELNLMLEASSDETKGEQEKINKSILLVLALLYGQTHSPDQAEYILSIANRLIRYLPITPLTLEDDEFYLSDNEERYQNSRCNAVFKQNGIITYIDGIHWYVSGAVDTKTMAHNPKQSGPTFDGPAHITRKGVPTGQVVHSRVRVKGGPFNPRTFIIPTLMLKYGEDSSITLLVEESDLMGAMEYYNVDIWDNTDEVDSPIAMLRGRKLPDSAIRK